MAAGASRAAWATGLQSGSPVAPCTSLLWSEEGQAAVVLADAIHILTPGVGYVDGPPGAEHTSTLLAVQTALEPSPWPEAGDEECTTATAPVRRTDTWLAAAWSPAGLGPHASCVLTAIHARGTLGVYVAQDDARHGPWSWAMDMDARHADGRSAAAARLGRAYTALAWGRIGDDAYLAAGTQGGDVVVWRMAHREGGPEATYTTTLRLEASVQHIGWNDARLAVCTTEAVHVLALSTTLERRAALPMRRAVSCLTWAASTLHMATPGALVCWDTTQPSATEHRVDSAYGAGTVGTAVALRTGALVGWDAQPRDPVWTPAVQPLWAVAEAAPLVATLAEADEHASWRYRVARRMSYTLYTPFDKDWDASEDQLARLYALFPSEARLPILRWRAVLLSAVQCAQQDVVLDKLCVRLDEEKVRPLAAACASLLESEADTYAAWASPAAEAQSARWCSAWASARSGARHAVADAASWLAERVVALASAAAALGAGDRGAHVERLAARLLLLAQDAPDSQPSFSSFLVQIARRLHPFSENWAMDDLHLGEVCAACSSPIPFSLAQYAQCTAGHVFERCVATDAILHATDTLTCVGCGRQALRTALASVQGPFPSLAACSACGNRWRSP